jgi:hypothetical protein
MIGESPSVTLEQKEASVRLAIAVSYGGILTAQLYLLSGK